MPQASRIRAEVVGTGVRVRVLMSHDMETGQRKDGEGKLVPAWFIQEVVASLNGAPVFTAQWGTAVAKNPFLEFTLRGARSGDKVAIRWVDNRGESRSDEVAVA